MSGLEPVRQACPLCGASENRTVRRFDDGVVVGRCSGCGLHYTPLRHPAPEKVLGTVTPEELRIRHGPILERGVRHYRHRNYREYLAIIERHARGRALLDVGCAHGFFGRLARDRGFRVTGIEPHPVWAAFARDEAGLEVLEGMVGQVELGDRRWDAITFTDSLEYITHPVSVLARLQRHLAPDGVIFVKVPNALHDRVRLTLSRLVPGLGPGGAFDPSLRVAHYDLGTLEALARATGFRVIDSGAVRPVDSPPWERLTGIWLEIEPPWHVDPGRKLVRRVFDRLGRLEALATGGRNDLSPAIYAVLRPEKASSST